MSGRTRILILSFTEIATDPRIIKQIATLKEKYDVITCGLGAHPAGSQRHIQLAAGSSNPQLKYLLPPRLYSLYYWNNKQVKDGLQKLEKEKFDVILANDLETVGLAVRLKPLFGVHADLHEFSPGQYEEIPIWKALIAPYQRWQCKAFLRLARSATTVSAGLSDEYYRQFGVRAEVVTNATPYYPHLNPQPVKQPIRLVHSGAGLSNRGIDVLIEAVENTNTEVTLDLFLMPNNPEYLETLRAKIQASDRVVLHPPVPYENLIATLNAYDVGIHVIPPVNTSYTYALPNKFFDYVQARLGQIIGPSPEMFPLINKFNIGAVSAGFGAEELVSVLDNLTLDAVRDWKDAAHQTAESLSWENQAEIWERCIADLTKKTGKDT